MRTGGESIQQNDKKSLEQRCRELEILNALSSVMNQTLNLEDVLNTAVEKIIYFFDVQGAEILLLEEESNILFVKVHRGFSPEFIGTGVIKISEGLAGYVAKEGTPVFLDTLSGDGRINEELVKREGFSSYGGVPLFHGEKVLGVLELYARDPKFFSTGEKRLLLELGNQIGMAINNALMYEQAAMRARRYITISQAIAVTRQLGTLDRLLQDMAKVLVQSLGFEQSWIGLIDETGSILEGRTGFGIGMNEKIVSSCYNISSDTHNPAIDAIIKQEPVIYQFIEDLPEGDFSDWLKKLKIQSFGCVPILCGDKAVGVIGVFYMTDQAFEEIDVKTLVSVAEQAAIAIENSRLYEQIKTSEERYRTLFEAGGTSLVILDEKQQFRLVNHAFEALSGYTQNQLIGKMTLAQFFPEKYSKKDEIIRKLGKTSQSWESQFRDKKGVKKQVHITTTHIPGSSRTLVSLIDMTRQRELERRLYRSEELAAIGELSAGIAHEIRNPLVAITTSVSLLKDESHLSQEGQQLLDVVKEESDHLAAIVDDFLKFARPKTPSFQWEDINKLLKDVVSRYRNWNGKKVQWVGRYGQDIPMVSLDRHQIQQVITNLLLNSLDAMTDGGVLTIETRKEKRMGENRVRITITDSGIGISKKEVSKIFQPFFSTKEKGTGMGLAICQRIVDEHDGEITVKSVVGKGTTFSVILPINRKNE